MYSTLKFSGVFVGLALLVGCNSQPMQRMQNSMDNVRTDFVARIRPSQQVIDPVQENPPADEATQVRGWDSSTFIYPNGAVLAYPTYGLNYEDRPKWLANDYVFSLAAPGVLIYDLFAMPVYMIMEPPGTTVTYHGARQPASMTLAIPMQTPAQARQHAMEQEKARLQQEPAPTVTPEAQPAPAPETPPTPPSADQPVKPEATPVPPAKTE